MQSDSILASSLCQVKWMCTCCIASSHGFWEQIWVRFESGSTSSTFPKVSTVMWIEDIVRQYVIYDYIHDTILRGSQSFHWTAAGVYDTKTWTFLLGNEKITGHGCEGYRHVAAIVKVSRSLFELFGQNESLNCQRETRYMYQSGH